MTIESSTLSLFESSKKNDVVTPVEYFKKIIPLGYYNNKIFEKSILPLLNHRPAKPNGTFCSVSEASKSEGLQYFVFYNSGGTDDPSSGDGYNGVLLDNKVNDDDDNITLYDNTTISDKSKKYNIYAVYTDGKCTTLNADVVAFYKKSYLENTKNRLEAQLSTLKNKSEYNDALLLAQQVCKEAGGSSDQIDKCVQDNYKKLYKNFNTIKEKQQQLTDLNDKLQILRLKNKYETESKNRLVNRNTDNDTLFTTIKKTLTQNFNNITNLNDTIMTISNKLKINNNLYSMKNSIIKVLTTIAIVMIILAIGFAGYFLYNSAKKHFPATLKGFRASQAAASSPSSLGKGIPPKISELNKVNNMKLKPNKSDSDKSNLNKSNNKNPTNKKKSIFDRLPSLPSLPSLPKIKKNSESIGY